VGQFLYIDATAGGLLLQVLVSGMAGAGIVAGAVWRRVTFRRRARRDEQDGGEAASAEGPGGRSDRAA
jgi:hypothetical protein